MSSNFMPDDKHWLMCINKGNKKLTEREEAIVSTTFDAETEMDILKIQKEILEARYIRKECLYYTLLAIPGYLLSLLIFSKKVRVIKNKTNKLYYKFLRSKITLSEFKKVLQELQKQSRIE